MMTTNKLTKILTGVATLSIAAAIAAPAQAGSLRWSLGTSPFFSDVNPVEGDTLSVTFSPGGTTAVSTATGEFVPPFSASTPYFAGLTPAVGKFLFNVAFNSNSGEYILTEDLVFAFDNGATVTWEAGTIFEYTFDEPTSVEFQLGDDPDGIPIITGIGDYGVVLPTDTFQFSDSLNSPAGSFNAGVDVDTPIPEPGTILGLLTVGGLGLVSRLKRQK